MVGIRKSNMSHILLIVPKSDDKRYIFDRDVNSGFGNCYNRNRLIYPPYSVALCITILSEIGHTVALYDAEIMNFSFADIENKIRSEKPSYIGVCTSYVSMYNDLQFAKKIRRYFTNIKLFVFGRGMKFLSGAKKLLENCFDYIVWDDPPFSLMNFIDASMKNKKYYCNRKNDDKFLEVSVSPSWEQFRLDKYQFVTLETSRGCPFGCEWCPYPINQGVTLKLKKEKLIRKEIKRIKKINKSKNILQFRDPIISLNKNHLLMVCKILKQAKLGFDVGIETRVEYIDIKQISIFEKLNIRNINLGIETASLELLPKVKKGISNVVDAKKYLSHTKEIVKKCIEHNIIPYLMFVLGFPEETSKTISDTISFIEDLSEKVNIQVSYFIPIPYTSTYAKIKDKKNIEKIFYKGEYSKICDMPLFLPAKISKEEIILAKKRIQGLL